MGLDVNARFLAALDYAEGLEPDAYFLTGDFCAKEPVEEVYHRLKRRLDRLGRPYHLAAGNHDDREMMRTAFGLPGRGAAPLDAAYTVGERQFYFLDSSRGHLAEEQLRWLSERLAERNGDLVIHHPPLPLGVRFMDEKYPLREPWALLDILVGANKPCRRVFCGHYHSQRLVRYRNLEVHLCPPTSFHLDPVAEAFEMLDLPPALQLLSWDEENNFSCDVHWLQPSAVGATL